MIGEIRVRGRNVMRGICGRTRDATFDADGWYPTGDLGALDVDGYLWYHGRLDDMFKVKGATVYPAEVEAAFRAARRCARRRTSRTSPAGRTATVTRSARSWSSRPRHSTTSLPVPAPG